MDNSCGITRNLKQYEPWPKVISPALKPIEIPFLMPEERGDSQPYPTDYSHIYNHGPSWIAEAATKLEAEANADSLYVWPGVVTIW